MAEFDDSTSFPNPFSGPNELLVFRSEWTEPHQILTGNGSVIGFLTFFYRAAWNADAV